jgi:hypothetical protein
MRQTSEIKMEDLVVDWKVRRTALDREITFRQEFGGVYPALSNTKLRRMLLGLDRQIAQYARA